MANARIIASVDAGEALYARFRDIMHEYPEAGIPIAGWLENLAHREALRDMEPGELQCRDDARGTLCGRSAIGAAVDNLAAEMPDE